MLADLKDRLAKFGLSLHEDKTRLIAFGRLPAIARQQRGARRPETFAFLGFTHYCGWTRDGRFIVKHKTREQTPDAQAEGTASRSVAAHAYAADRAASLVCQRAPRALRLLRHAAQLALVEHLPARSPAHLVQLPETAQPEEPAYGLGLVRDSDRVLAPATASYHPPLDTTSGPMRVTSAKSRVRESRLPGSVRAEPNGRATRP